MLGGTMERYRGNFRRFLIDATLTLVLIAKLAEWFTARGWFGDVADIVVVLPVVVIALYELWFGE